MDPIYYYVTPITPYLICDHYISTEVHPSEKYIEYPLELKANDILRDNSISKIKSFDRVQVQVDFFDYFYDNILPFLCERDIKVVLITSQWHLPQLQRSHKTDQLLEHPNILLWISQNPVYKNHPKYMAFPYGICHLSIHEYAQFISIPIQTKTTILANLYASVHDHLPPQHIRKQYELFGKNSGCRLNYTDYLTMISKSEFVISTAGDREDCYRHYECIGLNAIPISNINYQEIFGNNMVYSNPEDMVKMVQTGKIQSGVTYNPPDKNIITIDYWVKSIDDIVYSNLL
jgi:hypothetical protein